MPPYLEDIEFKKFLFDIEAQESPKMGFLAVKFDKEVFFLGEEVTGCIYLEVFRTFMQNKLACVIY